jgi:hypothetical protein
MDTSLRIALTATLALSALIVLARSNSVQAEASQPVNRSAALRIESRVSSTVHAPNCSDCPLTEPLQSSFDPEPTEPPTITGGSGTR